MKIILIKEEVDESVNTLTGVVIKSKHMVTAHNEIEVAHHLAWFAKTVSVDCLSEVIRQCQMLQDK